MELIIILFQPKSNCTWIHYKTDWKIDGYKHPKNSLKETIMTGLNQTQWITIHHRVSTQKTSFASRFWDGIRHASFVFPTWVSRSHWKKLVTWCGPRWTGPRRSTDQGPVVYFHAVAGKIVIYGRDLRVSEGPHSSRDVSKWNCQFYKRRLSQS